MLLTVETAASKTLLELLSTAQKLQIQQAKQRTKHHVTLQILGSQNVFIEHKGDAAVASGVKLQGTIGTMDFELDVLSDLNLISETANNTNVRLITR